MENKDDDFLGLCDVHGKCIVGANIWGKSNVMTSVSITTNSNCVKRAYNSKKRYSLEHTLELAHSNYKKDAPELLRALMYRAKVANEKNICLRQRGAISLGFMNI